MERLNGSCRLADLPRYVEPPTVQQDDTNGKPRPSKAAALGRFQTLNAFVDHYARLVDPTAQAVWLVLFREAKEGLATVSLQQIADCVGVHRRTVMRATKQLKEAGLLTIVKRGTTKHGPSTYRVHGRPRSKATGDAGVL